MILESKKSALSQGLRDHRQGSQLEGSGWKKPMKASISSYSLGQRRIMGEEGARWKQKQRQKEEKIVQEEKVRSNNITKQARQLKLQVT